jgi:RHS repeat-associated protein
MSNYGFTSAGTSYDDEDRLTGFARASGTFTQSWSLTSVGDWNSITTNGTAQNRTHGPTHELLTAGGQSVKADPKGNITLLPAVLSSTLTPQTSRLSYDFDNKLKSADVDNNGSNDVTFQYDALGRRVARQGTSGSFIYVQQDQQTIADYGYGDAPSSPTHRYVYASYIDEPVVRKAAGTSGTIHYYHRNQQYSITAVTTSSGSVAERYAYTAYGQPTILDGSGSVLSSSAINNRYTYTGREWDQTIGLYHFRARWMSGLTGRFLTRDPIGFEGSKWDLYSFLENRALIGRDPSGLCGTQNDDLIKKCMTEFRDCLDASVRERNRCKSQAATEARDFIRDSATEALRQLNEADRLAALARDTAIAECGRVNDRDTVFGEVAYQSCVGVAYTVYSAASTAAVVSYVAAEARIAAAALAFEAGRVTACGILYLDRNSTCDDALSSCLRRG